MNIFMLFGYLIFTFFILKKKHVKIRIMWVELIFFLKPLSWFEFFFDAFGWIELTFCVNKCSVELRWFSVDNFEYFLPNLLKIVQTRDFSIYFFEMFGIVFSKFWVELSFFWNFWVELSWMQKIENISWVELFFDKFELSWVCFWVELRF